MIAIAVGSGVGINTLISYLLGKKENEKALDVKSLGTIIAIVLYLLFSLIAKLYGIFTVYWKIVRRYLFKPVRPYGQIAHF